MIGETTVQVPMHALNFDGDSVLLEHRGSRVCVSAHMYDTNYSSQTVY